MLKTILRQKLVENNNKKSHSSMLKILKEVFNAKISSNNPLNVINFIVVFKNIPYVQREKN